jgi:hypothetical protein
LPSPGDPRQVFVVHVMKTGGTTVFRYLRENFPLEQLYPHRKEDIRLEGEAVDLEHHLSVPYLLGLSPDRHRRIRVYTGHFPFVVTELLERDVLTVTLLRDPVERTISLLRQLTRATPWLTPDERPPLALPLEEVYEHEAVFEPLIHDHQTKVFSMTAADAPQSYRDVVPMDQARLDLAMRNLEQVSVLGVTERYVEFTTRLEARTGWYVKPGLRKNVAPDEGPPVSASLRRRIAQDNQLDVELHAYATELVASLQ